MGFKPCCFVKHSVTNDLVYQGCPFNKPPVILGLHILYITVSNACIYKALSIDHKEPLAIRNVYNVAYFVTYRTICLRLADASEVFTQLLYHSSCN